MPRLRRKRSSNDNEVFFSMPVLRRLLARLMRESTKRSAAELIDIEGAEAARRASAAGVLSVDEAFIDESCGAVGFANEGAPTRAKGCAAVGSGPVEDFSMSKAFTALAILKLRDEGKVVLDAPAENYVPELKAWKYPTTDAPKITAHAA